MAEIKNERETMYVYIHAYYVRKMKKLIFLIIIKNNYLITDIKNPLTIVLNKL